MNQMHAVHPDRRVPFRVPLRPEHVIEMCRRRNQHTDSRTLAEFVESGLELVLSEKTGATVAQLKAGHDREIELFCAVVEAAPSALQGGWRLLYEHVWDRREYWIFPSSGGWSDDAPDAQCPEPHLDRTALAADWPELLAILDCANGADERASGS